MAESPRAARSKRTTVLAGGVGASRFLRGLTSLIDPNDLTIIVNTGDDEDFFGLHVSPDVDTILYTLGGIISQNRGWGVDDDSFTCLQMLSRYYDEAWFQLGDRDLATHIFRTDFLRRGGSLSGATRAIATALGIKPKVLPMSDDPVRTFINVNDGEWIAFQKYLVQRRGNGHVRRIRYRGIGAAEPARGVLAALRQADRILIPPSNPLVSIGPILALAGMRRTLRSVRARAAAISPIVGGAPIKGPLHRMLRGLGHDVSPVGVARLYRGLVDTFILDRQDEAMAPAITALGMRALVTDTVMTDTHRSRQLAEFVLEALDR